MLVIGCGERFYGVLGVRMKIFKVVCFVVGVGVFLLVSTKGGSLVNWIIVILGAFFYFFRLFFLSCKVWELCVFRWKARRCF